MSESSSSRRDFLTGKSALESVRERIELPDQMSTPPAAGDTLRLGTRAMACEFSVILNGGAIQWVMDASDALDLVHPLEQQMSVYRADSELSLLNRRAHRESVPVEPRLFALLQQAAMLCQATDDAFDPTSGPLVTLWRDCRAQGRVPAQQEIDACLKRVGMDHVLLDPASRSLRYDRDGVELNLGGIGKGYALDRAGEALQSRGVDAWLLHGGRSSLLAHGSHHGHEGWPVGIGNPLLTDQRLGTVLLRDHAMATSGSNIQFFRYQGRRFGHILDPRTGWPAEGLLSATVLARSAALADALSTAFFVLGVEKTRQCCDNLEGVGAILVPFPEAGRRLRPICLGIPDDVVFWNPAQVAL